MSDIVAFGPMYAARQGRRKVALGSYGRRLLKLNNGAVMHATKGPRPADTTKGAMFNFVSMTHTGGGKYSHPKCWPLSKAQREYLRPGTSDRRKVRKVVA